MDVEWGKGGRREDWDQDFMSLVGQAEEFGIYAKDKGDFNTWESIRSYLAFYKIILITHGRWMSDVLKRQGQSLGG